MLQPTADSIVTLVSMKRPFADRLTYYFLSTNEFVPSGTSVHVRCGTHIARRSIHRLSSTGRKPARFFTTARDSLAGR